MVGQRYRVNGQRILEGVARASQSFHIFRMSQYRRCLPPQQARKVSRISQIGQSCFGHMSQHHDFMVGVEGAKEQDKCRFERSALCEVFQWLICCITESRIVRVNHVGNVMEQSTCAELDMNLQAGAQIVLGDRPLEITLRRTWEALSLRERLDLMGSLLQLAFRRYERRGVSAWSEDDEDSSAEAEVRHIHF